MTATLSIGLAILSLMQNQAPTSADKVTLTAGLKDEVERAAPKAEACGFDGLTVEAGTSFGTIAVDEKSVTERRLACYRAKTGPGSTKRKH